MFCLKAIFDCFTCFIQRSSPSCSGRPAPFLSIERSYLEETRGLRPRVELGLEDCDFVVSGLQGVLTELVETSSSPTRSVVIRLDILFRIFIIFFTYFSPFDCFPLIHCPMASHNRHSRLSTHDDSPLSITPKHIGAPLHPLSSCCERRRQNVLEGHRAPTRWL